jgi:DNA-nicking Smr family endonuclease
LRSDAVAKLADLKKLVASARPARATPATVAAPVKRVAPVLPDLTLDQAFADVQKLPTVNRAIHPRKKPAPVARQTLADEASVLVASKYGPEPTPQSWDAGQEFEHGQTFVRRGIGVDVIAKLRRGHWSIQDELDLHGRNSTEAHDLLADFVAAARHRGARCVRVIHGKGLTSPGREPVLKGKVRRWLAHWDDVLAYAEAPQHAGGGGAVLVLLRGAK